MVVLSDELVDALKPGFINTVVAVRERRAQQEQKQDERLQV